MDSFHHKESLNKILFFLFYYRSIENKKKMLTDILKNCLKIHLKTIKQKSNIEVDSEDANGYIANSIQAHYEKYYVTIQPHNVKTRIPEELLKKK